MLDFLEWSSTFIFSLCFSISWSCFPFCDISYSFSCSPSVELFISTISFLLCIASALNSLMNLFLSENIRKFYKCYLPSTVFLPSCFFSFLVSLYFILVIFLRCLVVFGCLLIYKWGNKRPFWGSEGFDAACWLGGQIMCRIPVVSNLRSL